MQDIIRSSDVLLFPSFFEGFGLVILEAMACGLPVITTDATVGSDVIDNDIDGVVYNSFDIDRLKNIMLSFINTPTRAREMGLKAHEKASRFTWDSYGRRWEALLNKVTKL